MAFPAPAGDPPRQVVSASRIPVSLPTDAPSSFVGIRLSSNQVTRLRDQRIPVLNISLS